MHMRNDVLPNMRCRSKERQYNKEWADAIECRSMLDALEATARCAREREESRGAHYRDDFPMTKEGLPPQNSIVDWSEGSMRHRFRAVHAHRLHPPHLVAAK
jgi:succinate dehydrogenase/fumarate reductase flavoprotein subunit